MGCKSCEKSSREVYAQVAEVTGQTFVYYYNTKKEQIILEKDHFQILKDNGKIPDGVDYTLL